MKSRASAGSAALAPLVGLTPWAPLARIVALATLLLIPGAAGARAEPAFSLEIPSALGKAATAPLFADDAPAPIVPLAVALAEIPAEDPAPPAAATQPAWQVVGADFHAFFTGPCHFDRRDWGHFGLAVAAVGLVAVFDDEIQTQLDGGVSGWGESQANTLRPLGQEGGLVFVGLTYLSGKAFHKPGWVRASGDALEASVLSGVIVVPAMKWAFGRARPRDTTDSTDFQPFSGAQSFPSGEAAEVFALAAVYSGHTRNRWAKALLFATAAVVSADRVVVNAHWASDVVAGAMIGASIGHWVVRRHRNLAEENGRFLVVPTVLHGGGGLTLQASFK